MKRRSFAMVVGLACVAATAAGAELPMPPQLGSGAQADFVAYRDALPAKAFAIGPGGAWGWQSGAANAEAALEAALVACNAQAALPCRPFALDDRLVFDTAGWARAWRPYATAAEAAQRPVGLMPGARFPPLEFVDGKGRKRGLADFRGRPVVLHFWASWCAPCRHELPDMAAFAKTLAGTGVVVLPLQVREDIATSRAWLRRQRIDLPLYDSGARSAEDGDLRVAGSGRLPDRAVAPVFPSTVFLDRYGVIVFAHHGPITRWEDYRPQLTDLFAAQR
jgi:thiol-disulfide isomerase/thioredoxin